MHSSNTTKVADSAGLRGEIEEAMVALWLLYEEAFLALRHDVFPSYVWFVIYHDHFRIQTEGAVQRIAKVCGPEAMDCLVQLTYMTGMPPQFHKPRLRAFSHRYPDQCEWSEQVFRAELDAWMWRHRFTWSWMEAASWWTLLNWLKYPQLYERAFPALPPRVYSPLPKVLLLWDLETSFCAVPELRDSMSVQQWRQLCHSLELAFQIALRQWREKFDAAYTWSRRAQALRRGYLRDVLTKRAYLPTKDAHAMNVYLLHAVEGVGLNVVGEAIKQVRAASRGWGGSYQAIQAHVRDIRGVLGTPEVPRARGRPRRENADYCARSRAAIVDRLKRARERSATAQALAEGWTYRGETEFRVTFMGDIPAVIDPDEPLALHPQIVTKDFHPATQGSTLPDAYF